MRPENAKERVLDALGKLPDVSFLLIVSAAAGVAKATAAAIVDDPTPEDAFVEAVALYLEPVIGSR